MLADARRLLHRDLQGDRDRGLTEEFVRTESRSKLREKLMEIAPKAMPTADIDEIDAKLDEVFARREAGRGRGRQGTGRLGARPNSG